MSTPTPGPWRWMNNEALVADHGQRRAILTAEGLQTCGGDGRLRLLDIDEPNARLIALAPDLYDALKRLVVHDVAQDAHEGLTPSVELEQACDILAKVEGQ